MANKIKISSQQKRWLQDQKGKISYAEMARRFGVCSDTLKRILVREGIAEFEGAKYVPRREVKLWTRPCINCKDTTPRPKNLYLCEECRLKASHEDFTYGEVAFSQISK